MLSFDIILDTLKSFERPVHERELVCAIAFLAGVDFEHMMKVESGVRKSFQELFQFGYLQQVKPSWYTLMPLSPTYSLLDHTTWNSEDYVNVDSDGVPTTSGADMEAHSLELEKSTASYETLWDFVTNFDFGILRCDHKGASLKSSSSVEVNEIEKEPTRKSKRKATPKVAKPTTAARAKARNAPISKPKTKKMTNTVSKIKSLLSKLKMPKN